MLELLFVIGFFVMLMVTGVSLLGIIAALVVATAIMFLGGMLALMIKLLPWLLLAIAVVWVIKAIKAPKVPKYQKKGLPRWKPYFFYGISRLEPCVARLSRISCARCASFSGYFCCSATSTLITPLAIKENSSLLASVNSSRVVI